MNDLVFREGTEADATAIHDLIRAHEREGHLLPRTIDDVRRRTARFVVATVRGTVKACAELAPLSSTVAEIRSLVVSAEIRHGGVARRLLDEIGDRARTAGFKTLCAFTHDPRFFVRQNFSIVPHQWLPEKIAKDCTDCPLFRHCGQFAMVLPLTEIVRYGAHRTEHRRMAVA